MTSPNAIAIIGMSGRFPGAASLDQFWENLKQGTESIDRFTIEEMMASGVPESIARDPDYVPAKGIIDDIAGFDADFFGFSPREASHMDPQHRIFLECAWQALEHAGYDPLTAKAAIGLYAGCGDSTYLYHLLQSAVDLAESAKDPALFFGNFRDFFATRVAYRLNLHGPSINIQTACSTSLVAIHSACAALLSFQCDMAVAGGIHISVPHKSGNFHQQGGVVSPDGHCRAFDANASGTVASDGVGVIILKRMDEAVADGDVIHAVILGSAVNNDGADKIGYTAPSVSGQAEVITLAQEMAQVDPADISYIEAHGTGTKLGDPIELQALTQAFRRQTNDTQFCAIGSLKTNIGHLDAAAGVAGLIKTVLALQHEQIPPSLHFKAPNPDIDFKQSPFFVNTTLRPWSPQHNKRVAGISSFGIGGTNAHVILTQAPDRRESDHSHRPQLIVLSARTATALETARQNLYEHLQTHSNINLADASFTLGVGRHAFSHRLAIVAHDCNQAMIELAQREGSPSKAITQSRQRLAFLYPGQGLQCVGMGQSLYETEHLFKQVFDQGALIASTHLDGVDLRQVLYGSDGHAAELALVETQYAQPALFLVQYALTRYLESLGLRPDVMLGHSIGEWVAACVAGVFTFEQAIELVCNRARLMQACPSSSMLGVELTETELYPHLNDELEISVHNAQRWLVVSGAHEQIDALRTKLEKQDVTCHALRVSHAFHSRAMDAAARQFTAYFDGITLGTPQRPFISNVTGTWITDEQASNPAYWAQQLRAPVKFHQGVEQLQAHTDLQWIEAGPGQALSSFARMSGQLGVVAVWPRPKEDAYTQTIKAIGRLWVAGLGPAFEVLHQSEVRQRIVLPTYPFEHQTYWIDAKPLEREQLVRGSDPRASTQITSPLALPSAKAVSVPRKDPDISNWFYLPKWESTYAPPSAPDHCHVPTILILDADTTLATHLDCFDNAVVVSPATSFNRVNAKHFELALTSRQDYESLFESLAKQSWHPRRIIHAINLKTDPYREPQAELALAHYLGLLSLAQAAAKHLHSQPLEIMILASGLLKVRDDDVLEPDKATLLGPAKVIPLEYPNLSCRVADFDRASANDPALLIAEITANDRKRVVAYRSGQRYIESFGSHRLPPPGSSNETQTRPLRQGGHYLITGGLGGVGMAIAHYLVTHVQAKVTLVNRSAFPAQEKWPTLGQTETLPELPSLTGDLRSSLVKWSEKLSIAALEDHDGLAQALVSHAQDCMTRYLGSALEPGQTVRVEELKRLLRIESRFDRLFQFMLGALANSPNVSVQAQTITLHSIPVVSTDRLSEQYPAFRGLIKFIDDCTIHYPKALSGEIAAIQVLYPDGKTDRLDAMQRDTVEHSQQRVYSYALRDFLSELASGRPLRVLEIGGGQGLLTQVIAPALLAAGSSYHFTDISPFFINRIQTALPELKGITTGLFDITRDPESQGLSLQHFDVIVGLDVVHATPNIAVTLGHLRKLLAPSGYLALIESVPTGPWIDLCWGLADGWWLYEDQALRSSALMHPDQWESALVQTEFSHHLVLPEDSNGRRRTDVCLLLAQTSFHTSRTWLPAWQAEASSDPQVVTYHRIQKLIELQALGGEVNVISADIGQATDVRRMLTQATERFGDIHGVIHSALVLEDKLMQLKDADSARRVMAPKIQGSLNLLHELRTEPLDFFVHCSSLAAPMGLYAQSDYCAATAFQDALAHWMKPAIGLSINWGVWRDAGFAMRMKLHETAATERWSVLPGPLLNRMIQGENGQTIFEGAFKDQWVVTEHRLNELNTLPGTGYISLALEALDAANVLTTQAMTFDSLIFSAPLTTQNQEPQPVRVLVSPKGQGGQIVIASLRGEHWVEHARGRLVLACKQLTSTVVAPKLSELQQKLGFESGASHHRSTQPNADAGTPVSVGQRWLDLLQWQSFHKNEALGLLELPEQYHRDLDQYPLHPAILDIATSFALGDEAFYLPIAYDQVRVHAALTPRIWSHLTWERNADSLAPTLTFGVHIFNDDGTLALEIGRYTLRKTEKDTPDIALKRLTCSNPGVLDSLQYVPMTARPDIGDDEVEIRVTASGLNFLDVLTALGLSVKLAADESGFGRECAGVVSRVGKRVKHLAVGNEVVAIAGNAFDDLVYVNQHSVRTKPAAIDWETAASFAVPYMTAHFSLTHRARLRPSESVLIHAGAGGVGLAAVALAKNIGATIFATAGSDAKRQYLKDLGVDYVFNSRSPSFAQEIRQISPRGIDVVLNSLGGDLMQASLELLAPHGRFLELGKRDFAQNREIGLAVLANGITYFTINLGPDIAEFGLVFDEVINMLESGTVPALPVKAYRIEQTIEAFKDMAAARHIGKLVVTRSASHVRHDHVVHFSGLDAPMQDPQLREGMSSSEGAQAFARALASGFSQVLVTPQNFHALLERNAPEIVRLAKENGASVTKDAPEAIEPAPTVSTPSDVSTIVQEVWREYLGVDTIKATDSFFSLGGDSLIGIQIMAQLRKRLGIDVAVGLFFESPTLQELTIALERLIGSDMPVPLEPEAELITTSEGQQHEPFALTDVQQAYWIGRSTSFELGNVAAHGYFEVERSGLDFDRFCGVWMQLVRRHDMLRMVVNADGQQQVLAQVGDYQPELIDLRLKDDIQVKATLDNVRQKMASQVLPSDQWPLFDIRVSQLPNDTVRIHMSFDALIMDAWSSMILGREFSKLYANPDYPLPRLEITFRDYVLAEQAQSQTSSYERAQRYWLERLDSLPPAPLLPLAIRPETLQKPEFTRREARLSAPTWQAIKQQAATAGVTPSVACLTCFADVLARWSETAHFSINLTLFNRPAVHPQINDIVGDFTSLTLLEIDTRSSDRYRDRARHIQQQLGRDLDHRHYSGVKVLRELVRTGRRQSGAIMPVVFTSTLALDGQQQQHSPVIFDGTIVYGLSQTPQVWLDHGILEENGELVLNFNSVDDLFPTSLIDDMFQAYQQALGQLAASSASWDDLTPDLPAEQRIKRQAYNNTSQALPIKRLESAFFDQLPHTAQLPALLTAHTEVSYQMLCDKALALARALEQAQIKSNECVGIHLPKGWHQIAAVLGVLRAGGAYVPLDPSLPNTRLQAMAQGMRLVVTTHDQADLSFGNFKAIVIDELPDPANSNTHNPPTNTQDLAYVIYTSGSTGTPKGVMIEHQAAMNTIADLTDRFKIHRQDRVLALSSLGFDLSVFDIFGLLNAGGALVMPDADAVRDPSHWYRLLNEHQVTIWNSVPALMTVMVEYLESNQLAFPDSIRLVMLSGDWIPTDLPNRITKLSPQSQVISLGGATEASIWSIYYPIEGVESDWTSIPYGYPLANQTYHVLDSRQQDCPDWVTGELYIGGAGLSRGYWQDPALTNDRFVTIGQQRLYRTGDLGRFVGQGWIEFQGRNDSQVKIQGYRIEISEVEAALRQHPLVDQCAVKAITTATGSRQLAAYVVTLKDQSMPALADLRDFMRQSLPEYMVPSSFTAIDCLALTRNGKVDYNNLPQPSESQSVESTQVLGSDSLALEVLQTIGAVLQLTHVNPQQNLLDLGIDSIGMIRLANRLESRFGIRPKIGDLYRMHSIAELIEFCQPTDKRKAAIQPTASSQLSRAPLITDPDQREAFRASQNAVRQFASAQTSLPLAGQPDLKKFNGRTSQRHFALAPISFESLGQWLEPLRQVQIAGKPKYLYASAGGLYPVQTYIYVKAGRIDGLSHGVYYHDPLNHSLVPLSTAAVIAREDFDPIVNQPIFDEAAFCVFFVAAMARIEPMYGEHSDRFVNIEAGLMAQCLDMSAADANIGLCHVGEINATRLLCALPESESPRWLLSLLGGQRASSDTENSQDTVTRMLARVSELSPEQTRALLAAKQGKPT